MERDIELFIKLAVPKENRIVVKNTYEPLVDRFIFESVQNNVKRTMFLILLKEKKDCLEIYYIVRNVVIN